MEQQQVLSAQLETHQVEAQNCFLPGTQIQFADAQDIVIRLLEKAIYLNGCFICHLTPTGNGYPYCQPGGRAGDKIKVSRLVYFVIVRRVLPSHILVCHECDNRPCINPAHLFEGSSSDNTQDMISKGRHKFILPDNQKVNPEQIRELRQQGLLYREIAEKLNVSISTVNNYFTGPYKGR